jgi:hypothetical protein
LKEDKKKADGDDCLYTIISTFLKRPYVKLKNKLTMRKDYIPLSGSTSKFINQPDDYKSLIDIQDSSIFTDIEDGKIEVPSLLTELTSAKTETIKLSVDAALKLQIPIGSTDNKLSRTIFIQEFKQYKEITKNQEIVHYGISIRWIINIQKLNSSANITSLPMIAASGQFNYVNASARFEVNGISSKEIIALIPAPKDLTTETYVEFNDAFMKIKDKIWDENVTIAPKALGIYANIADKNESLFYDSVTISYALKMIAKGKLLGNVLMNISEDTKKDLITSVYSEITNTIELYCPISTLSKEEALKYIKLIN